MTYIDIHKLDTFESILAEAIYGGPALPEKTMRAGLRKHGLSKKFFVTAIRIDEEKSVEKFISYLPKQGNYWALSLHPELLYFLFDFSIPLFENARKKAALLSGLPQVCKNSNGCTSSIQQAILALRQHELAQLKTGSRQQQKLTGATEQQSLKLAQDSIWRGDADWSAAAKVWIEIVLMRHSKQLNEVRRRVIEFLAQLTCAIDHNVGLAYPFRAAIDQVYSTFAISSFPQTVIKIIEDIKPHLIKLPASSGKPATLRKVDSAINYLNEHITEPFNLDNLSSRLHVSPNHLARVFKAHTGKTVVQYLHALRIGLAKDLLRQTDKTILAVALESGFESTEHFHRIFKRLTGATPGQYRKGGAAGKSTGQFM